MFSRTFFFLIHFLALVIFPRYFFLKVIHPPWLLGLFWLIMNPVTIHYVMGEMIWQSNFCTFTNVSKTRSFSFLNLSIASLGLRVLLETHFASGGSPQCQCLGNQQIHAWEFASGQLKVPNASSAFCPARFTLAPLCFELFHERRMVDRVEF